MGGHSFPTAILFGAEENFLEKEVFFVHSHAAVQKRHSRGSKKMYTFVFQGPRAENRAKKRSFSTNLGPQNGQNSQNGPFWPLFGDFRDFLRNCPPTPNPASPRLPEVVFLCSWDMSDQKTPLGSSVPGYLRVGGIFKAGKR